MNFWFILLILIIEIFLSGVGYAQVYNTYGALIGGENATEYCYDNARSCGSKSWAGMCQTGQSQSPVALTYRPLQYTHHVNNNQLPENSTSNFLGHLMKQNLDGLRLLRQKQKRATLHLSRHYSKERIFNLVNDGHTVLVQSKINQTSTITLDGSLLRGKYIFCQLHFHWGSGNDVGSEHTINGRRYPMEAHLVHYSAKYENITEALKSNQRDAVAVIGVFFELPKKSNSGNYPAFNPIVNGIKNIRSKTTLINPTTSIKFKLSSLFVQSKSKHLAEVDVFQYYGSLTTPGCNEVVLWNILTNSIRISTKQMRAFRKLTTVAVGDNQSQNQVTSIVDNFRPLQNLNGRKVKTWRTSVWFW